MKNLCITLLLFVAVLYCTSPPPAGQPATGKGALLYDPRIGYYVNNFITTKIIPPDGLTRIYLIPVVDGNLKTETLIQVSHAPKGPNGRMVGSRRYFLDLNPGEYAIVAFYWEPRPPLLPYHVFLDKNAIEKTRIKVLPNTLNVFGGVGIETRTDISVKNQDSILDDVQRHYVRLLMPEALTSEGRMGWGVTGAITGHIIDEALHRDGETLDLLRNKAKEDLGNSPWVDLVK